MQRAQVLTTEDGQGAAGAHLIDAERGLIWTRRAAFAGWGIILYAQGHELGLTPAWMTYLGGVLYMLILHRRVRQGRVRHMTSWVATICDSIITFLMCLVTGGAASPFVPFFYFTTLAGAFRFGVGQMAYILGLNGSAIIALHLAHGASGIGPALLTLFYLGFAAALGAMLAGWARTNLDIALSRSAALRIERDRSNGLLRKLIDTQEEERKNLAGDLHDRMGARLFHIQHSLDECMRQKPVSRVYAGHFSGMHSNLVECNTEVRALMNELRPNVLDDFGFTEALSEHVTGLVGVVGFAVETRFDPELQTWRSRQDAMLFRLLQEALLNVRKHSGAMKVMISMARVEGEVVIAVEDDGCGFDPAGVPAGHFGILMMRERAQAAGGELSIGAGQERGTRVAISFPEPA